jgi:hypothetical protein
VIVVADVFLNTDVEVTKRFKIFSTQKINKTVRRELLSSLYLTTTRRGITLELVSFDLSEEQLAEVIDFLDKKGTNPFRYFMSYGSIDELIRELPYRPEVVGVLDIPNRLLRYGHWGLDFNSL